LHLSAFCHQDSHHHHDHRRHDHDAVKSARHGHSHSDEADVALNFDECQSDSEQHHRTLMVDEESLAFTITNSQPMHPWATESILGSFASIDDWNSTLHRGLCTPASCQHLSTELRPDLPLMLRI